jgi:hypothetical protein
MRRGSEGAQDDGVREEPSCLTDDHERRQYCRKLELANDIGSDSVARKVKKRKCKQCGKLFVRAYRALCKRLKGL